MTQYGSNRIASRPSATFTRRQLLGASATAAGLLGLGGLLPAAAAAQDEGKSFHGGTSWTAPPNGHFNVFVTDAIMPPPHFYGDMIWQPFALYNWGTKEWLPLLGTAWAFVKEGSSIPADATTVGPAAVEDGADTFQVKLRQGVKWSDGNDFTAKDVMATLWVQRLMSNVVWQYLDKVEALDDYTVNFHMQKLSTVVQRYVLRTSPSSAAVYGEWASRAEELFTSGKSIEDPEGKQLLDEFTKFRPAEVVASGPYNIDQNSITNASLRAVKVDTAWNADQVKFDNLLIYRGETDTITPIVLAKKIDYATHGFPPATEKQMIAEGIRIVRPPIYSGPALYLNYGKYPDLADKRVRQAFAMAINRDQNGKVALADSGIGVKYMTGMSDNFVPDWVNKDAIAQLKPYAYDPDAAAKLLTEAGWTKDGDTWTMPNGQPASFTLSFPAEYADWSASGQDAADQLNAFGIKIEPLAVTYTQQPVDVDRGRFDLAIQQWGSSTNTHPHYSYSTAFFTHNTLAINNGGKGIQFPLVQQTDVAGKVDLEQLTLDSAAGLDEAKQKDNVTTIALVFNELLPIIPLFERYGNNAVLENVRVQPWPPDDNPIYKNSPYADGFNTILTLTGQLKPVE